MNPMFLSAFLVLGLQVIGIFTAEEGGPAWDYYEKGEDVWFKDFPACAGMSQSPINIVNAKAKYSSSLKPFVFENYDAPRQWEIKQTPSSSK